MPSSSNFRNITSNNDVSANGGNGATYFDFVKPAVPQHYASSSSSLSHSKNNNHKRQRKKDVSDQLLKDYKDLEDKSSEIFKIINAGLSNLVKQYDLNNDKGNAKDNDRNKETLVLKMLEIQTNEKFIKLQFDRLISNNFKSFYKNLVVFNSLIFTNFNNISVKKRNIENSTLKKKKNINRKKRNITERIENIQTFAELLDQRLRILELAKKLIVENR